MATSPPSELEAYARELAEALVRDELATFAERPLGLAGAAAVRYWRERAFYVTGILVDEILKKAKGVLLRALKQDKTPRQVEYELDEALHEFIPQKDAAGRAVNVPARIETIARTNLSEAVNEGRMAAFTDPDVAGFVVGLQYSAVMDNRTRPNHAAWDQVKRPLNDPVWFGPPDRHPPNGFGCRCLCIPVTVADDQTWTPDDKMPKVEVSDPGFE